MPKPFSGRFKHSVCTFVERDAFALKRNEPNCKVCNAIVTGMVVLREDVDALREELNAQREELSAVREELEELKEKVDDNDRVQPVPFGTWQHGADAQHGTKRKAPDASADDSGEAGEDSGKDSEEDESEESDEEFITPSLPKEKPKPKSITISGDGKLVPSGEYKPYGDGHYVLAKAMQKANPEEYADLLNGIVLAFEKGDAGYYLVAKKSADGDGVVKPGAATTSHPPARRGPCLKLVVPKQQSPHVKEPLYYAMENADKTWSLRTYDQSMHAIQWIVQESLRASY